jgi:hypothetical protein
VITTYEIEQGILKTIQEIDDMVEKVARIAHEAAVTESDYKAKFAKQRLSARAFHEKATVGQIDDLATEACQDEALAYRIAENRLLAIREALRACQARLDGYRTLSATHRSAGG